MPPFSNPLMNLPDPPEEEEEIPFARPVDERNMTTLTPDRRPVVDELARRLGVNPDQLAAASESTVSESTARGVSMQRGDFEEGQVLPPDRRPTFRRGPNGRTVDQQQQLNEFKPNAPTIDETDNVFNQSQQQQTQNTQRTQQGQTRQRGSNNSGDNLTRTSSRQNDDGQRTQEQGQQSAQGRTQGQQRRTDDRRTRTQRSVRTRTRTSDFTEVPSTEESISSAAEKIQMLPPGATQREVQEVLDQGKIPITQPDLSGVEEFVRQPLDFSQSEDALRQFAEAKVQAAKQGALASRQGARNANTRLLANAFGPGLFQALTGTQQPTNQQTNFNANARRRVEEANQAQSQFRQTAVTAPAQAEVQASEISRQEQQLNQQNRIQTQKLNNSIAKLEAQTEAKAQQRFVDLATGLAEQNRQAAQDLREMETELQKEAMQSAGNPNVRTALQTVNKNLARAVQGQKEMEQAINILSNPDTSEEQQTRVKRYMAQRYGEGQDNFINMTNQALIDRLTEARNSFSTRREELEDDRVKLITQSEGQLPQSDVGFDPTSVEPNINAPESPESSTQEEQETPDPDTTDTDTSSTDAESEFQQNFGGAKL